MSGSRNAGHVAAFDRLARMGSGPRRSSVTAGAPTGVGSAWPAIFVVCFAQFMVVLDATIVNVALPSIQRGLRFTPSSLQWVINMYTLTFGGFLLLGGRAGDLVRAQARVHRGNRVVLRGVASKRPRPVIQRSSSQAGGSKG